MKQSLKKAFLLFWDFLEYAHDYLLHFNLFDKVFLYIVVFAFVEVFCNSAISLDF